MSAALATQKAQTVILLTEDGRAVELHVCQIWVWETAVKVWLRCART